VTTSCPFARGLNEVLPPSTLLRTEATSNAGCWLAVGVASAITTMTGTRRQRTQLSLNPLNLLNLLNLNLLNLSPF
jgi:hypothetical protein